MLQAAGARSSGRPARSSVWPVERLELDRVEVPGDFSSAAPLIVAATLLPGSELDLHGVGINPTRTGLLDVLERMRARVTLFNKRKLGAEPVADIEVRSSPSLVATRVAPAEVPRMVDELPLVALLAGARARRDRDRRRPGTARKGNRP